MKESIIDLQNSIIEEDYFSHIKMTEEEPLVISISNDYEQELKQIQSDDDSEFEGVKGEVARDIFFYTFIFILIVFFLGGILNMIK